MLQTARSIAALQRADGAIPWPDGHVDPWDHVECAMALSACGLTVPARLAYQWLRGTQRPDGPGRGRPEARRPRRPMPWPTTAAESHHAAYVAVGVWHEYLVTGDRKFTERMWPTVRAATGWVLGLQAPRGEVAWERDAAGRPGRVRAAVRVRVHLPGPALRDRCWPSWPATRSPTGSWPPTSSAT